MFKSALAPMALLLVATPMARPDDNVIVIRSPDNDIVVMEEKVTFQGTYLAGLAGPDPEGVVIVGDATPVKRKVNGLNWVFENVPVPPGTSNVSVKIGNREQSAVITRVKGLKPNARHQKFRFVWSGPEVAGGESVDDVIRDIARKTLDNVPANLDDFVNTVKREAVSFFQDAFREVKGIEQDLADQDGPDVQTILFLPSASDDYGSTPLFDCGNSCQQQTSQVYVGTYRYWISFYFSPNRPKNDAASDWSPMKKDDKPYVRAYDLGRALGRSAAHEAGHGLGLVGSRGNCDWMQGCNGSHNCSSVTARFGKAERFKNGWHIMDPGEYTKNQARLALSPDDTSRDSDPRPAVFNAFNRSYLRLIQP